MSNQKWLPVDHVVYNVQAVGSTDILPSKLCKSLPKVYEIFQRMCMKGQSAEMRENSKRYSWNLHKQSLFSNSKLISDCQNAWRLISI